MGRKFDSILDAVVAAAFISIILGVCLAAGDYLLLIGIERLLERWALLPIGWGTAHEGALGVAAILLAVPPAAFVAWWIYRSSRASSRERLCSNDDE